MVVRVHVNGRLLGSCGKKQKKITVFVNILKVTEVFGFEGTQNNKLINK